MLIAAIVYGDTPHLPQRLLQSLQKTPWDDVSCVCLGLNEVSDRSKEVIKDCCKSFPVDVWIYEPEKNVGKYPLLRRIIQENDDETCVAYFDDDVYVMDNDRWTWVVKKIVELPDRVLTAIGHWYEIDFQGEQREGFKAQPWYTKRPWYFSERYQRDRIYFPTGSFWAIKMSFLRKWDFPFPQLFHNGGDTALGQLLWQQDAPFFNEARAVSRNPPTRRGINTPRLWSDWPALIDLSHQQFDCEIYKLF